MNKAIITIARQFGSGGAEVGRRVAEKLGIAYYDKNLLDQVAESTGISRHLFEKADEKSPNVFLSSIAVSRSASILATNDIISDDKLFLMQFDEIKQIAARESCVIIGRCADDILKDHANSIHVFISASAPDRIERLTRLHGITEKEAENLMRKTDKKRAAYYNFYTNKKWGQASLYDLCVNTSFFGIDGTVDLICKVAQYKSETRM